MGFFCFVFRANIDEVETEVVEIEAKLDKVSCGFCIVFAVFSLLQ